MARQTSLNPDGTLLGFGSGVRLERGPDKPEPGAPMVWVLFKRVDVTEDKDTTYDYRFDEVRRFAEADDAPGEPPRAAIDAAQAAAGE
jgi:hypothetical protein